MNKISNIFIISLMLLATDLPAQTKQLNVISWKVAGKLPAPAGLAGAVSGISNNALIVAGGNNFPDAMPWLGGKKKYYDEIFVYTKANDKLVLNAKRWKLPFTLSYAAVCTTPAGIAYAGGENEDGISNKAGIIVWDASAENIVLRSLPNLPLVLTNASASFFNQTVYISGGENVNGVSDHLYALDLNEIKAGWKQMPSIPKALSHTLAVVQSDGHHDCLYLIGGRKKNANGISELYASVFAFDIVTGQWQQKKSLPYALSAATGIANNNNQVFIFGSDKGETFHRTETLITAINNEADSAKKQLLNQQKISLQSSHPGFSAAILVYNTMTGVCSVAGTIPFNAPVTTNAFMWGDEIVIPGGEIKAGVRTADILIGSFFK